MVIEETNRGFHNFTVYNGKSKKNVIVFGMKYTFEIEFQS